MKIPQSYQLFTTPVVLSDKDEERLSAYLIGWDHLAKVVTKVNEPDLQRLIVLELLGKQRWKILDRLIMRLGRLQRAAVEQKVKKCLRGKSSKQSS